MVNKKEKRRDSIGNIDFIGSGYLKDIIKNLQKLHEEAQKENPDCEIIIDVRGDDYGDVWFSKVCERLETDEEFKNRRAIEEQHEAARKLRERIRAIVREEIAQMGIVEDENDIYSLSSLVFNKY